MCQCQVSKDRTKGSVDHSSILKSKSGPQKDRTKGMFDHQFLSKGRFYHIKQLCTKLGASFFYWLIRKVDDRQWCTHRIILNNAGEGAYDFERTNHHVAYYVFPYSFSPIWFANSTEIYKLMFPRDETASQLVAYSPQPSKPTKSHCCRQGKRRCVPNMKHRMQNTNTNSTSE